MKAGLPRVAVIGYPNVGKSTLVNRLSGTREAVTHPEPGVTRDRKEVPAEWNGVEFALVDTGGVDLSDASRSLARSRIRRGSRSRTRPWSSWSSTRRPVCARAMPSWPTSLRRSEVPALVAANKLDRGADAPLAAEFHGLGLGEPVPVSAAHGLGTGDLLDRVAAPCASTLPSEEAEDEAVSASR